MMKRVDVLMWWQHHEKLYPLLFRAAKKYLAIQAKSCACERTLCTSGNQMTSKRTLLMTESIKIMVSCKEYLPKVYLHMKKMDLEDADERETEMEIEKPKSKK